MRKKLPLTKSKAAIKQSFASNCIFIALFFLVQEGSNPYILYVKDMHNVMYKWKE